jgi:hypothetical protein
VPSQELRGVTVASYHAKPTSTYLQLRDVKGKLFLYRKDRQPEQLKRGAAIDCALRPKVFAVQTTLAPVPGGAVDAAAITAPNLEQSQHSPGHDLIGRSLVVRVASVQYTSQSVYMTLQGWGGVRVHLHGHAKRAVLEGRPMVRAGQATKLTLGVWVFADGLRLGTSISSRRGGDARDHDGPRH